MSSDALAARVRQGVEALAAEDWNEAIAQLEPVADDPALEAAADLQDVRARVHSLLAQALMHAGRLDDAQERLRTALRILRAARDKEGTHEVRALQDQVVAAVAQQRQAALAEASSRKLAARSVDEVVAGANTDLERASRLIEKANADLDAGTPGAATIAQQALEAALKADAVREEVLARLSIARADPEQSAVQLSQAWSRAEQANEFVLVGLVARAAELAGVALPSAPIGGRS